MLLVGVPVVPWLLLSMMIVALLCLDDGQLFFNNGF
jgi:hypothetical protein